MSSGLNHFAKLRERIKKKDDQHQLGEPRRPVIKPALEKRGEKEVLIEC